MIYLDNAATTMVKPQCVVDAVTKAMTSMGNAARGAHSSALDASRVVYQTRVKLAEFFNCKRPDHVVFTTNATESLNIAIRGALEPGCHVITTDLEHNSVLRPLYLMERENGVKLSFVEADKQGNVKAEQFEELIRRIPKPLFVPMRPTLPETWWILKQWDALPRPITCCLLWTLPRQREHCLLIWSV